MSLRYTLTMPTHPISVQCWARVAAIAGSMPVNCVRRWLNITPTLTKRMILLHQRLQQSLNFETLKLYPAAPPIWSIRLRTVNQCCFNVDPTRLTIAQQQPTILYIHGLFCGNCYRGDNFIPRGQKGHYLDTLVQCEIMLGHRLRRWANIIPTKTL